MVNLRIYHTPGFYSNIYTFFEVLRELQAEVYSKLNSINEGKIHYPRAEIVNKQDWITRNTKRQEDRQISKDNYIKTVSLKLRPQFDDAHQADFLST